MTKFAKLTVVLFAVAVVLGTYSVPQSVRAIRPDAHNASPNAPQAAPYLLGPEVRISTPSTPIDADRHKPDIVYNYVNQQYLVVWHNAWPGSQDIYAQRVSKTGQPVGPWFAVVGGANVTNPAAAYNAQNGEFLIVWMKEVSPDVYEIWGRIISYNNSYQRPEFKIISWANRSFHSPRVAWNSYRNEYLVVWNAFNTTTSFPPGVPNDIGGHRVSASGQVINPGSPLVFTTYSGPHQVDMTYNVAMNEYFLTFVVIHTQATTGNDIYGLRVNGNTGAPVMPPGLIPIYEDVKNQNHPAVATNEQDKYMVVWEHTFDPNPLAPDRDIYGREYNANGTPGGSYFTIASWTQDDTVPDVAANGASREWLTVWQRALPAGSGYSIHGFRWGSASSAVYTYLFDVVNWSFHECTNPVVAAAIPGYFIAYEETIPVEKQHIYGRPWWPEAIRLPLVERRMSPLSSQH
jgi:hypothetical protein